MKLPREWVYHLMNWTYAIIGFLVLGWACFAEDITTGNLLPNGSNNASNYQNVDTSIPNITTNGFNTTGSIRDWGQELETTGTGGINVTGSLLNITTGEDTTNQDKLDNGVTLNSTTIVQNCEYQGSNWQCGQAKPGQDTYTTTVSILDANGNVLSTVNQVRNNDAGYNSNAYKYLDTVTYTGTGSSQFYWGWEGVDLGHATYGTDLGGPNLLGAKLTMTYDNVVIQPEVIEEIEEVIEEFIEWEELFEEPVFETVVPLPELIPVEIEVFEEVYLEETQAIAIIEETFEELEEEFEEVEILEVWGGPEIVEEPLEEEPNEPEEVAPEIMETEQVVENEPEEATTAKVEETTEEPEVESSLDTPGVAEAEVEEEAPVVEISVQDIQAQVSAKIESVEKSLATTSIVAAQVMTSKQVDLSSYYKTYTDDRKMYEGNDYTDLRILGGLDIYTENNNKFLRISSNDPVLKYQRELQDATIKRIQLEKELQILRR
jgi:hypothetical protein